jgi:hypothetical protein
MRHDGGETGGEEPEENRVESKPAGEASAGISLEEVRDSGHLRISRQHGDTSEDETFDPGRTRLSLDGTGRPKTRILSGLDEKKLTPKCGSPGYLY